MRRRSNIRRRAAARQGVEAARAQRSASSQGMPGQNYQQGQGYMPGQGYQQDPTFMSGQGFPQGQGYMPGQGYQQGQPFPQDQGTPQGSNPDAGLSPKTADAASNKKGGGRKKRHRGPSVTTVVAVVILVAGVGIISYPTVSDWWNSYHQSRAIATYVNAVEETDPAMLEAMLAEARAYNERLASKPARYEMTPDEELEYTRLLDLTGNGVMGYVQINSINVDYPIYHGMDESVLQIAIGHLKGTSLPVGGETTHAVISGHRGLPRARLFTDLDRLVEGDTFTVTVLDQTCTYEVDQIRIVLPTDLSDLNIEQGKDYCTLITCTPYGINTHRLLVRGHRVNNILNADVVTSEAVQIPRYIAIPAVGVPILFMFLIGMLVYYRVRRPEFNKEVVTASLRERINRRAGRR